MCYYNQWGEVCSSDDSWKIYTATVVCRQLGDTYAAEAYKSGYVTNMTSFLNVEFYLLSCYAYENGPSTLGYHTCSGYSNLVINCTGKPICFYIAQQIFKITCSLLEPIPEYCSGTCTNGSIRLVGGPSPYKGRVEVCFEGCWGSVNSFGFHSFDASVTCRQLGFPAIGKKNNVFGNSQRNTFYFYRCN